MNTLPLSREQIEAIQARAEKATPDQFGHLAIPFEDVPTLCQMALRAIELEAEVKNLAEQVRVADEAWANQEAELTATRKALEEERERCAKVALNACLVPPDGGSPTEGERLVCEHAAELIRALSSPQVKP